MIRKLLEALFQHKLLLLLPPVLIPALVTPIAAMNVTPVYETTVSVWLDRPTFLRGSDGTSPWTTATQVQAARLTELLRTRAFADDVAQRTSLAPLIKTAAGEIRAASLISSGVSVNAGRDGTLTTASEHLLIIHVQAPTAQLSYEIADAVVNAYQEKSAADQADRASVAVDYYQSRLKDSQQQLSKATADLRRYSATLQTGSDALSDPNLPGAMLDPKLAALQANVQAAQLDVNSAQGALKQAQQDTVTAGQDLQYGFQVLDPPELPTAPTNQLKKFIIYPIAATIAGLVLTALLLIIFVASDRSVRSELDLQPDLRLLGSVPMLQLKRVPKKLRSGATRRAIGAPAGMALPAAGAK